MKWKGCAPKNEKDIIVSFSRFKFGNKGYRSKTLLKTLSLINSHFKFQGFHVFLLKNTYFSRFSRLPGLISRFSRGFSMLPGLISRFSRFSRSDSHPAYQAEFWRVGDFLSHYFSKTYREINFVHKHMEISGKLCMFLINVSSFLAKQVKLS